MSTHRIQYADLQIDDTHNPESKRHGDVYYSRDHGIEESRYVFLEQNNFPNRWSQKNNWVIAETGFGTGLNFYLCAHSFLSSTSDSATLHFISFEKYPISPEDLKTIVKQWPEYAEIANAVLTQYPKRVPGLHRIQVHPRVTLDLYLGDVSETTPDWAQCHRETVDAWFLDGFAPSKNPDMWQQSLYQAVAHSLVASGTFTTFTATGHVRRGLQANGLQVFKTKGFGKKREMLTGRKLTLGRPQHKPSKTLAIVGSGIAAACMAQALKSYPGEIIHIYKKLADGASGNPQAAVYPPLQAQWNPFSEFYLHAFLFAKRFYSPWQNHSVHWSGLHLKARSVDDRARQAKILKLEPYQQTIQPGAHGIALPEAGWISPVQLVHRMFEDSKNYRQEHHFKTTTIENTHVSSIKDNLCGVSLCCEGSSKRITVDSVVLCCGHQANELYFDPPIRPVRGQVTQLKWQGSPKHIHELGSEVICEKTYATPLTENTFCIGATFEKGSLSTEVQRESDTENLNQFNKMSGEHYQTQDIVSSRASIRATTPDHFPMIGTNSTGNISMISGLGSRGFTSAPLVAETLASQILKKPLPVGSRLLSKLTIDRFSQ